MPAPNFADDVPSTDWSKIPVYDHYPNHKITSPETPESCCDGGRCHAPIEPSHVPPGVEVLTSQAEPSGGHPEFQRILDELWDLHLRKGADYGTDVDCLANIRTSAEFGVEPWRYAILRANEKVSRLKRFARDKTLANETVEDSLLDLASQAILALVLLRE